MNLLVLKLLFDFGLVVLVWMVQLVIYPSFIFFSKENLIQWHRQYTLGITYIVLPLMLSQLFISTYLFFSISTLLSILHFTLILINWMVTFLFFVPKHKKISLGNFDKTMLVYLVKKNWIRTILWTIVFLLTFLEYFGVLPKILLTHFFTN